jgi:hypothetical protein
MWPHAKQLKTTDYLLINASFTHIILKVWYLKLISFENFGLYIGPYLTSSLGVNFQPPGAKLSPGGEILCSPLHSSKQDRVFTPGGERRSELPPRGQISPLGPGARGEVKNALKADVGCKLSTYLVAKFRFFGITFRISICTYVMYLFALARWGCEFHCKQILRLVRRGNPNFEAAVLGTGQLVAFWVFDFWIHAP